MRTSKSKSKTMIANIDKKGTTSIEQARQINGKIKRTMHTYIYIYCEQETYNENEPYNDSETAEQPDTQKQHTRYSQQEEEQAAHNDTQN